jgi:hypothetical protein
MRYQVTVTETISKYAVVEADSVEEAKSKGYDAARDRGEISCDYAGPTKIAAFRIADKEQK